MKKLLFTIATENIREAAAPFLANHASYARRNNYEYVVKTEKFFPNLHPSFSKTGYVQQALRDGFDFVLFADADIAFISQGVDLANLLIGTDYWLAAYEQKNWPHDDPYLNAGLFVVKQCQEAHTFVDDWVHRCLTGCPDWKPGEITPIVDFPWENWHFHGLCRKYKWKGIRCCNAEEIGCFCPTLWHDGVLWYQSCPTIHFAGCNTSWEKRAELFVKQYAPLVS